MGQSHDVTWIEEQEALLRRFFVVLKRKANPVGNSTSEGGGTEGTLRGECGG